MTTYLHCLIPPKIRKCMETPFQDCVSTLIPSSPFSQALMAALQVTVSQTPTGSKGAPTWSSGSKMDPKWRPSQPPSGFVDQKLNETSDAFRKKLALLNVEDLCDEYTCSHWADFFGTIFQKTSYQMAMSWWFTMVERQQQLQKQSPGSSTNFKKVTLPCLSPVNLGNHPKRCKARNKALLQWPLTLLFKHMWYLLGTPGLGELYPLHFKNDPNLNFDLLVRWLEKSQNSSHQLRWYFWRFSASHVLEVLQKL